MADAARIAKQFASGLRGDWSARARTAQLPPPGAWHIFGCASAVEDLAKRERAPNGSNR